MTETIDEKKRVILDRDGWKCTVCGAPANQLGHVIPQSKLAIAKYGKGIIHHPLNMESVCGLECNKQVEISVKTQPIKAGLHASMIMDEIVKAALIKMRTHPGMYTAVWDDLAEVAE